MGQLVDDKVDHLVHVNLLSLDFSRDVRLVAFEGAVVSYADWLARARFIVLYFCGILLYFDLFCSRPLGLPSLRFF